jgi:aminomethyltransferase
MSEINITPLNESHKELGGNMVDFHGWEMPVIYDGLVAEHLRTRKSVSLFDVSHMGEVIFEGNDALACIQHLTTNDVASLAIGQVQYSAMLYEDGTIVDDITVYRLGENRYQLCINSANTDKDIEWIRKNISGDLKWTDISSNIGQIAIQGCFSDQVLQPLTDYNLKKIKYYWCAETELLGFQVLIARMGYTGEDGFEIFCQKEHTLEIWKKLLETGKPYKIAPAGLGARDTLRLEMCYCLYGNDIDDEHNALESNLGWIVKMDTIDFIGKSALQKAKETGIKRRLIPFILEGKGVPRQGYKIFDELGEKEIGIVSSGTSSPCLKRGIGMGYVGHDYLKKGTKITIQIRNKNVPAIVTRAPFVEVQK